MGRPRIRFITDQGPDVSDADAGVGDVLSPKTFYSVAPPRKTGTMPTVAIVAANDNYPAGYHAGDVGGLDAIDADLAVGNIKNGITIFGKLGTVKAIYEDEDCAAVGTDQKLSHQCKKVEFPTTGDITLADVDVEATAATVIGVGYYNVTQSGGADDNKTKGQLLIGGVQVAETAWLNDDDECLVSHRENLSGTIAILVRLHQYDDYTNWMYYDGGGGGGSAEV